MNTWSNETTSERNELVFESRNQKYGAYQIRREYGRSILISSGLAVVAFFSLILMSMVGVSKPENTVRVISHEVTIHQPPVDPDKKIVPLLPPSLPSHHSKMDQFTTPEVSDDSVPTNIVYGNNFKGNDGDSIDGSEGDGDSTLIVIDPDIDLHKNDIITYAEVMPDFPGFMDYLIHNIRYPIIDKENGKQGTVYISFVVEKDGTITNVTPAKEVKGAPGLTKEAMSVISQMPNWSPGLMNGRPVRVEMKQPVCFVLR